MVSFFPEEYIVSQSLNQSATLTSHRICSKSRGWGRSAYQYVMLEDITSCEKFSRNPYFLLILGGFCVAIGLPSIMGFDPSLTVPLLVLGLLLLFFYWCSRSNLIIISSPDTQIRINVLGLNQTKVLDFMNKIEQTKRQRIVFLNKCRTNSV